MPNDTAGQLARIREKVEGMGLDWERFQKAAVELHVATGGIYKQGDWYDTAESLLAVLDPDAMVVNGHSYVLGMDMNDIVGTKLFVRGKVEVVDPDHEYVLVCRRKVTGDG